MSSPLEQLPYLGVFAADTELYSLDSADNARRTTASYAQAFFADPSGPWNEACRLRTTADVDLAGGGLAAATVHDGVTAAENDIVLVADQADPTENGVYLVPATGAASRAVFYDSDAEINPGDRFHVYEGTAHGGRTYEVTSPNPHVPGTDAITFGLWIPPTPTGGGGGGLEEILSIDLNASPTSQINIDVSEFDYVRVTLENVGFAGIAHVQATVSNDAGASDYILDEMDEVTATAGALDSKMILGSGANGDGHGAVAHFYNLQTAAHRTRMECFGAVAAVATSPVKRMARRDALQIEDSIQIKSSDASTMNAGFVRAVGVRISGTGLRTPKATIIELDGFATSDYSIPANCTRVEFHSGTVILPAPGRFLAGLKNSSGTIDTNVAGLQTYFSNNTVVQAEMVSVAKFASSSQSTLAGQKQFGHCRVWAPRDPSSRTLFDSVGIDKTGATVERDQRIGEATASSDDDTIQISHTASGNFTSGKVYLTAYFD